jgi:beta-galactosidase
VMENASTITLSAGAVRAEFDQTTGRLVYFGATANLLQSGPRLNVWRAATDNDGLKLWAQMPGESHKALPRWLLLGLNDINYSLISVKLLRQANALPVMEVIQHASGRENWGDFTHISRYSLLEKGELQVDNTIVLGKDMLDIPRIGVELSVIPGLERLEYFGRGPLENYWDRKASAMVGHYRNTVSQEYVPYIMPQEHGHHTDVRWLTITNEQGSGLRICGSPVLEFNVSHFNAGDLFDARHTSDLSPRPEVIVSLDAAQRGLGTASCGPDTLVQYQIREKEYQFNFRMHIL